MLDSAELKPVSPQALTAFKKRRLQIMQAAVTQSMEELDKVNQHGDQAEALLTAGIDFTTQALEISMQLHNVEMLEYQLQWAWDRLPHDGVQPDHILSRFKILAQVIESILTAEDAREVTPFVKWLIKRQNELIQERNK
jgi:Asp-tRNA(Asn)/Glu-tRNA(Gln) amidotransferase C subunit